MIFGFSSQKIVNLGACSVILGKKLI